MTEKLITSKEFREMTGLSRMTETRHRASGRLSFYKIGTRVFYSQQHIEDFLARHERPARGRVRRGQSVQAAK
jgi:Helix-turn-helix domain